MSTQAVHDLLQKAERNEDLNTALESALRDASRPVQSFLDTAREHGCEFTADEFLEVMATPKAGGAGELSESELETVTGGLTLSYSWASLAKRQFTSYRTSPGIRQIGPGAFAQEVEEEEIQA